MSIKTVKSIKQQKIMSASAPNIMEAAKSWKPTRSSKGRKSVLVQHIDTIRYLRGARKMSYKNICEFFNANGVKTSYVNLVNFASKQKIGGSKKKAKIND